MCRTGKKTKTAARLGHLLAATSLIPAICIARVSVDMHPQLFWVSAAIACWSEYRLGWYK